MSAPGLLVVGGANPIGSSMDIVRQVLTQARARGLRTHLTHRAEELASTTEVTALADGTSAVDPDDPGASVRWAREQGQRFDVVLGLRDQVVAAAAEAASALGAVGNPPEVVRLVRNKDECRAALAAAGFRQPAFRLCADLAEASAFLAQTRGPWVLKPRDAMASIGVCRVDSAADLPEAIAGLPEPAPFLVEEFVDGPEFSAEGVFLGGEPRVLALTAKETLPPPHFVEAGHVLPADLPEGTRRAAEREVAAALTALGVRFGVFHVEFWLSERGIVLGEVHPRPGGDWLHALLGHAIPGLELFGLLYDDVLGRAVPPPADLTPVRAAAARFLVAPPGRLVRVEGWERVLAEPGLLHAELSVSPGELVRPVQQSGDRAGVVIVGGATAAEARATALRLAGSVEFVVEGSTA